MTLNYEAKNKKEKELEKMAKIVKIDNDYYFDGEDGQEAVKCVVWVETSKKSERNPEGKPWIKLPKNNVSNRQYFSLEKFEAEAVNDEIEVPVKTEGPRVLGATGAKPAIIKYLNEEQLEEFNSIVDPAIEEYKARKGQKKLKIEDIKDVALLEQMISALENGEEMPALVGGPKSFKDCMSDEDFARYNELLAIAQENKANAPKAVRGPLTEEQKAARKAKAKQSKINKLYAALEALKASQE